jgi:hypothetical protein
MRGWTIFAAVCLSGAGPAAVQSGLRYHVVHGWPQLPGDEMLDEVSAVAVDGHDDVLVLTRGAVSGRTRASSTRARSPSRRFSASTAGRAA